MIPQPFIDDLLARIDVVEVIDSRVPLKKTGRDHMACCPFHDERTPSFSVSRSKQFYHCFGCGANGNAIGFLMAYERMHFVDAIETLARIAGVEVPRDERAVSAREAIRPLLETLDRVERRWRDGLRGVERAIALLRQSGVNGDIARQFGVGYVSEEIGTWTAGLDARHLERLGITQVDAGTGEVSSDVAGTLALPLRDRRKRPVGFRCYALGEDLRGCWTSPESALFNPEKLVFGEAEARRAAESRGELIVLEDPLHVLECASAELENVVAVGAAALLPHTIERLFGLSDELVFVLERRSGRLARLEALLAAALPALRDGRDVHVVELTRARRDGGVDALFERREPVIDALCRAAGKAAGRAAESRSAEAITQEAMASMPKSVFRRLAEARVRELTWSASGKEGAS